jgi:hypothetical protein
MLLTRNVYDVGYVFVPFNRGQKSDSAPSDSMVVSRNSYDANIRGGRVIFYCMSY